MPQWTCPPTKSGATAGTCCCPRSASRASGRSRPRGCCASAPAASARRSRCTSPRPGVGTLGIVDFDVVDFSNLQRQLLHMTRDVGRPKVESAARAAAGDQPRRSRRDAPASRCRPPTRSSCSRGYDLVVDGTDNFPTRYLVNDACVLTRPALRLRQHLPVRRPGLGVRGAGRSLLPLPLPRAAAARPRARAAPRAACSASLPGIIGTIQATEALKLILRPASRSSAGC